MIILDDNYTVTADKYCWTLHYKEQVGEKDGKPTFSMYNTYHAVFEQVLEHYINDSLKKCDTLAEVLEKLKYLEKKIDSLNLPKR